MPWLKSIFEARQQHSFVSLAEKWIFQLCCSGCPVSLLNVTGAITMNVLVTDEVCLRTQLNVYNAQIVRQHGI